MLLLSTITLLQLQLLMMGTEKLNTQQLLLTGMSHDHLDWPRLSYREPFKEGDEELDRNNDGKTTSKSGLALNGIPYYRKPRTARS